MTKKAKPDPDAPPRVNRRGGKRDAAGFTDKERAFVLHYLGAANRNGTEAALMAGWAVGNRPGACRYASEVLQRPHIVAEIQRLTEARNERLGYTADDVLRELLRLKTDVETLSERSAPAMRTRLDVLKTIGDHVAVGAFRRNVGLSSPSGGPIETVDHAALAGLSDEELDQLERGRAILDRIAGRSAEVPDVGADQGGEGEASPDA